MSLKEAIESTLEKTIPSLETAENPNLLSISDQKVLKILVGRPEYQGSFDPDDRKAVISKATALKTQGSDFRKLLKEQGFVVDMNIPSDLAVSERFYRTCLKNDIQSLFIIAIENSENRGEGKEFSGFFRAELKEEDGHVLYTSNPITDEEARRLETIAKTKIDVPKNLARYEYHHLSTYLRRLAFDRNNRYYYKNDFEVKDNPETGGKMITRRIPVIALQHK